MNRAYDAWEGGVSIGGVKVTNDAFCIQRGRNVRVDGKTVSRLTET